MRKAKPGFHMFVREWPKTCIKYTIVTYRIRFNKPQLLPIMENQVAKKIHKKIWKQGSSAWAEGKRGCWTFVQMRPVECLQLSLKNYVCIPSVFFFSMWFFCWQTFRLTSYITWYNVSTPQTPLQLSLRYLHLFTLLETPICM